MQLLRQPHLTPRRRRSFLSTTTTTLAATTTLLFLVVLTLLPTPAVGLIARLPDSAVLDKRQLRAETLDGSIVEPVVVDFLDQFQWYQNEVNNGIFAEGTEEFRRLLDETRTVSVILNDLIRGYATIVSGAPELPAETPVDDAPVENTILENTLETAPPRTTAPPRSQPTPAPTATTTPPPPRPSPTASGPFTVIARPNTSVIVVASGTATQTVTVPPTVPGAGNRGSSPTTTFVTVQGGVTQTIAVLASAEMTRAPSNGGVASAAWSPVLGGMSAVVVGLLMNVL